MAGAGDRYVIAELNGEGHRFWYVSLMLHWLARNAASADVCLITTRTARASREWDEFIAGHLEKGRLKVAFVETAHASINTIARMLQSPNAKLLIPDGDRWLGELSLAASRRQFRPVGTLLIMRPFRTPGVTGSLRHIGKLALIKSLQRLAPNFRVLRLAPTGTRISDTAWVNDPVEFSPRDVTRTAWCETHGLTPDRRYLVALGDLSHRKYVPELLKAFDSAQVGDWHLVLVGRLGAQERAMAEGRSAAARYSVIEGFVSSQDFDTWISKADAVAILHRNEGASGILGKCAVAGVPVLIGGAQSLLDAARVMGVPRCELPTVGVLTISKGLSSLPTRMPGITVCTKFNDFAETLIVRPSSFR
jgi:hypothetical protein